MEHHAVIEQASDVRCPAVLEIEGELAERVNATLRRAKLAGIFAPSMTPDEMIRRAIRQILTTPTE